jgi:hypothetical protein
MSKGAGTAEWRTRNSVKSAKLSWAKTPMVSPAKLKLKYNNAMADAVAGLGRPEETGNVFGGFQNYLTSNRRAGREKMV